MHKRIRQTCFVAAVTFGAMAVAGPASAGRTVIDGNGITIDLCSSASATPCTTPSLLKTSPFLDGMVADFGFGPFDSIYAYDNGLISIGAPIAPGADYTSLPSIGGNVLTAGYSATRALFASANIQGPQSAASGGPFGQPEFVGKQVVRITFCAAAACYNDNGDQQVNIYDLGDGAYALTFNYGATSYNGPGADPVFPADAYAGYSFGGTTMQQSGTVLRDKVLALTPIQYVFQAAGAVPEPGTWAMMLLGFFGMGSALRLRRREAILAR